MSTIKLFLVCALYLMGMVDLAEAQQPALRFVPLTPCRIADTRPWNGTGPFAGPSITALGSRSFPVAQSACSVPSTAKAYSVNVTAVPSTNFLGYITVWPSDQPQPFVSLLNATDGRVKAVAAIVPAAATTGGAISVYATDATDIILDINGYFVDSTAPAFAQALAFFPLPPCRVVETRWYTPTSLGPPSMLAGQQRSFPILTTGCNIPTTAQAYSLNFTVVPKGNIGFLAAWPTGPGSMPVVSTLNVTTGAVTANAAIVPAVASGAISVMATGDTDLLIDINGYFAPSTSPNDLSFYTVPPCRIRDTRENTGAFSTAIAIDTTASPCRMIPSTQAVVVNATVVPTPPGLGFLTLWPHGQTRPEVSTTNAQDNFVTSNMAIVPTTGGVIDAYGSERTQLILDTTGYFASGTALAPITYTLTVTRSGSGTGTVTGNDGKFNCGSVCSVSYVSGTSITLTASPSGGSTFGGWSGGGCSGTTASCTVGLSASKSVTATFNPPPTVTGSWQFNAFSSLYYGIWSSGYGTLQQNGTSVTGEFTMSGTSPCATRVTLNGTLTGTTFTFKVQEGLQTVDFSGTIDESYTYAEGSYSAPLGGCTAGDYGTWWAQKW